MSMKEKALHGLSWSFVDNVGNRMLQFAVGIVMARLLSPREYGLLGMVTIFVGVSNVFIDCGFTQSLVIRKDSRREDYSTVFFFNLAVSLFVYLAVVFSAPFVAGFFKEPELVSLLRVYALTVVLGAMTLVQRVELTKRIDFKTQAKITLSSTLVSSVVGIVLAYRGFGVWSLVIRLVVDSVLTASLFWLLGEFRLLFCFDRKAFREMFAFGSRLLASGLIDRGYEELYKVVIGKFFSVVELGFYTRAIQFTEVPALGFMQVVQRVSSPVLAQLPLERRKDAYRRIIQSSTLLVFSVMVGLMACSRNLVLLLLGRKWIEVVPYLQLLCLGAMLYPLHALNLEILWICGDSKKFLRLEILKKLIDFPVILVGIRWGIRAMLIGLVVSSVASFFVNSRYSGRLIGYPTSAQIVDLVPNLATVFAMGGVVHILGRNLPFGAFGGLASQVLAGVAIVILAGELFRFSGYQEIRDIAISRIKRRSEAL